MDIMSGQIEFLQYLNSTNIRDIDLLLNNFTLYSEHKTNEYGRTLKVIYVLFILIGLLENCVIIGCIIKTMSKPCPQNKYSKHVRNLFILLSVISDMTILIFYLPLSLWEILNGWWVFGSEYELLCKLLKFLQEYPVFLSAFAIVCVGLDRYRCIVSTVNHLYGKKEFYRLAIGINVISTISCLPVLWSAKTVKYLDVKDTDYYVCQISWTPKMQIFFSLGTLIIQFVIPFVVIVVVYVGVLRKLKSRKRSARQSCNRKRAKTIKFIGFVMLNFVITWAPYNVINFLFDLNACNVINLRGFGKILSESHGFIQLLAIEHSCINPITYAYYHKDIRKILIKLIRKVKSDLTPENTQV